MQPHCPSHLLADKRPFKPWRLAGRTATAQRASSPARPHAARSCAARAAAASCRQHGVLSASSSRQRGHWPRALPPLACPSREWAEPLSPAAVPGACCLLFCGSSGEWRESQLAIALRRCRAPLQEQAVGPQLQPVAPSSDPTPAGTPDPCGSPTSTVRRYGHSSFCRQIGEASLLAQTCLRKPCVLQPNGGRPG